MILFLNSPYLSFLLSSLLFYICTKIKKSKPVITYLVILVLILAPIIIFWSNGYTNQKIIGGLIPHRDGMYYYLNARNILSGNLFDIMINGRAIFPSFLSFLVYIAQENIQAILLILAIFCSISFYYLFRLSESLLGPVSSSIFMGGIYNFHKGYAPQLMSEQLGLLLSMIGLSMIIQGMGIKKKRTIFIGIFYITMALNARVGAMMLLPGLAIFMGFFMSKERFSIKSFLVATSIICLGLLINYLIFNLSSQPGLIPYSSFANALYGQSKGGAGWTSIQKDFPGLVDAKEIIDFSIQNIRRYPLGLIIGSLKAFRDFLMPGSNNAFVFITGIGNNLGVMILWTILWLLTIFELINCCKDPENPYHLFEILIFASILFSVPLAPPIDSGSMRTYAVTIPFLLLIPMSGLSRFLANKKSSERKRINCDLPKSFLLFSFLIMSIIVLFPLFLRLKTKPDIPVNDNCPSGQIQSSFHLNQGSFITIIPDGLQRCTRVTEICLSKFTDNTFGGINELHQALVEEINNLQKPVIFSAVNDLNNGRYFHIMMSSDVLKEKSKTLAISACLSEKSPKEFLYYVEGIIEIVNK